MRPSFHLLITALVATASALAACSDINSPKVDA